MFPEKLPFEYDLHPFSLQGSGQRTMICMHGYGDNHQIAHSLKETYLLKTTLVSFNFPEYDIKKGRAYDPCSSSFGTINELLPALFVMRQTILERNLEEVDLYGFSAGGAALIHSIIVLNGNDYDLDLQRINIGEEEKQKMLAAIQRDIILLDAPLKSIEEIIDFRGSSKEFQILAKKYLEESFRPIDSLKRLKGLRLNVLLYFDQEDEVLSNRDDLLYIERFKEAQPSGKVTVIFGEDGGHMAPHFSLWTA